jgi:hypothetical protein
VHFTQKLLGRKITCCDILTVDEGNYCNAQNKLKNRNNDPSERVAEYIHDIVTDGLVCFPTCSRRKVQSVTYGKYNARHVVWV